jgi:hypothetical protein
MNQDIRVPVNVNRLPFMTKVKSALGPEGAYCYILLHCLAGEQFFSGTFENLSAEELEGLVGWRGVKGELVRVLVDLGELKNGATGYHLARWVSWNSYAASFPIRSLTGRKNRIKGWKIKRGVLQEKQEDDSEPTREPNREPTKVTL